MFRFNVKWTPAQMLIFHLAISGLISAVVAGLLAAGQYIVTTGLNVPELGRIFAVAFLSSFMGCYLSIKNNPATAQAIMDGIAELKGLVIQAPMTPQAPFAPYVTIHTGGATPTVEPPAAQPSVRRLDAFQVPPRPVAQPPIQMPVVQPPPVLDVSAQTTASQPVPPQVVFAERSFSQPVPVVQPGQ